MDDDWVSNAIYLIDDLVFTLKVDRATHQDKGCVESIFVTSFWTIGKVYKGASNDLVINTLLLSLLVNAHVTNDSETKLCNL